MSDADANEKKLIKKPRKSRKPGHLVDPISVKNLASLGMTLKDIADNLNTSWTTLHRRKELYEAWRAGREDLKMGIRKTIFKKALVEDHWPAQRYLADHFLQWGDGTTIEDLKDVVDDLKHETTENRVFIATLGPVIDVTPTNAEPPAIDTEVKKSDDTGT